jgi:Aldo/keto reductase family
VSIPALQTLTLADDLSITRMGYGAMQLTGLGAFGPPKDRTQAIAVLRAAVELGITHIDTSDFYGPTIVNELIKEALRTPTRPVCTSSPRSAPAAPPPAAGSLPWTPPTSKPRSTRTSGT